MTVVREAIQWFRQLFNLETEQQKALKALRAQGKDTVGEFVGPWNGVCPDCGSTRFYEGPEGGICVNIMCADEKCSSKFNWARPPVNMIQRI